jgi:hypothetical protein
LIRLLHEESASIICSVKILLSAFHFLLRLLLLDGRDLVDSITCPLAASSSSSCSDHLTVCAILICSLDRIMTQWFEFCWYTNTIMNVKNVLVMQ